MYMYEENFKRSNEDITLSDAVANASDVIPESYKAKEAKANIEQQSVELLASEPINVSAKAGLTIKKACIIAAAILIVSGIAVFCILRGGGVI